MRMNAVPRKRFPWIWYLLALLVIGVFAFAPIGSVILCAAIANAYGCKVDEGSVHPCIINGHDYGELLYSLGVMGWLMLVSLPAGLFCFRRLADFSDSPSCQLAKTDFCRSSSSDSPADVSR
jgi:uncharacterized membrane protein